MTSYDLIWRLIELILKDKEAKSDDKSQKKIKSNLEQECIAITLLFFKIKKLGVRNPPSLVINLTSFD